MIKIKSNMKKYDVKDRKWVSQVGNNKNVHHVNNSINKSSNLEEEE